MQESSKKPRKCWHGPAPVCDFCKQPVKGSMFYDAATRMGPWASMCLYHFMQYGLPTGQEYKREGSEWFKTRNLNGQPDRETLDDENAEMLRDEQEHKS